MEPSTFQEPTATFRPIAPALTVRLLEFVDRRNIGKAIEIDGKSYRLDHISHNVSAFFRSRGLSIYFRVGRSVIRISDHWARSEGNDKSRKLNCGHVSGKRWIMAGPAERIACHNYAGRFPFVVLAGICGLASLNRTCDHWSA